MTRRNVVFASDANYVVHMAVAMYSLFKNNPELKFDVHVVNSDIDAKIWGRLESMVSEHGHKLIDVRISEKHLEGVVLGSHFTKANYYRLFIADEIAAATALYLDSDLIVCDSIREIYGTTLDNSYLAAVLSPGFDRHAELEMSIESKYFNSGVMLLNLELWRRDSIAARVIDLVKRKPSAIQFVDQCGINSVLDGRWTELHPRFNVQSGFFEPKAEIDAAQFKRGEFAAALEKPAIMHYSGSIKPWHLRSKHPYRHLYWQYLRQTPFNYYLPTDLTVANVFRACARRLFKRNPGRRA
jgi:lipopolysaccharide biosynthesis glycosyltransferase